MRIALIGYGKMGKAIEGIALQHRHEIILKIRHGGTVSSENLKQADVAIEFTNPEAAFDNVTKCFEAGVPVVCGTTGWNERFEEAKKICGERKGAFFYASNFSIGVNIFFELNRKLAQMMRNHPQYNLYMSEVHHTQKKDSPSGTAITLANDIINSNSGFSDWKLYSEESGDNPQADDKATVYINSLRLGDVPGTHEVLYNSDEDEIKMIHTAHSRKGFATGAVLAAEWLAGKQGVFTMKDLLNL
jgi:4-hydroxy-tetrahydrodipicolinate reductase